MNLEEKLKKQQYKEIWQQYCGFLDLSMDGYMKIQRRLMEEQIRLWSNCGLGQSILKGKYPKNLDEFRKMVPLTTYEDYADVLLTKQPDMLPGNPMRSERIASLSRYVMVDVLNPAITAATQWFERTLDDSANKRLSVPEAFLAIDGILDLYLNVVDGLVVYPKVIEQHLMNELPFMATENIMMDAVKAGGDRQELHEKIRQHSMAAGRVVKEEGKPNDLLERIAADPSFGMTMDQLKAIMKPENFVGRAPQQVEEFVEEVIQPILDANKELLGVKAEINV